MRPWRLNRSPYIQTLHAWAIGATCSHKGILCAVRLLFVSRPAKQMHRGVMRFLRVLIFVESRRCISANQPDSRRCRLAGEPADPSRVHKPTHVHTLCEPTLLNPAFVSASASAPSCALPARDRHVTCRGPPTQPRIQPLPLFPSKPFQPRRRRL